MERCKENGEMGKIFVLENLVFLFKDIYTISMSTGGMEIVSKQGKGILQGLRKYYIYREKKA